MAILNIQTQQPTGLAGVNPAFIYIETNDTLAEVLATGYLTDSALQGFVFLNSQSALVSTSDSGNQVLQVVVSAGLIVSLVAPDVVIDDLTVDELTLGSSGNAGLLDIYPATASKGRVRIIATDNTGNTLTTLTNAAMGQASVISIPDPGASTANIILSKGATSPQTMSTGLTLTGASSDFQTLGGGDILAGTSGAAGSVFSYPATVTTGRIEMRGVSNAADYTVTVANASHGQSTVYSIPDVGAATGQVLVKTAALVDGQLIKASGTAGKTVGAGFSLLANTTAAYGGGGTSNAFTATGLTTASIVTASILTSTNAVSIAKVVPTANTLTITFSADPGASTTVSYIAISAAV
ncbi:MAG: hypothetical protein V4501_11280 [Pseudomonadota bacterium]